MGWFDTKNKQHIQVVRMDLNIIKKKIKKCLRQVYDEFPSLVEKYNICERSIMHRFAFYLQKEFKNFWVDCEFNKQFYKGIVSDKIIIGKRRFIDIVIHKRGHGDFLCFELKKEGSNNKIEEDREKLKVLTSCEPESFQYRYGFFIVLNEKFDYSTYELYKKGELIEKKKISELPDNIIQNAINMVTTPLFHLFE